MDPQSFASAACSFAEAFALFRILKVGFARTLPWFTTYLVFSLAQSALPFALGVKSRAYREAFFITMSIVILLRIAIVVELCRYLLASHPGIAKVSKSLLWTLTIAAVLISAAGRLDALTLWGVSCKVAAYHILSLLIRYTGSSLCIACAGIGLFALSFENGISPNITRHAWISTLYFSAVTTAFLILHHWRGHVELVNAMTLISTCGCFLLWGLWMTRDGAIYQIMPATPRGDPEADSKMITLLRTAAFEKFPLIGRLLRALFGRNDQH